MQAVNDQLEFKIDTPSDAELRRKFGETCKPAKLPKDVLDLAETFIEAERPVEQLTARQERTLRRKAERRAVKELARRAKDDVDV